MPVGADDGAAATLDGIAAARATATSGASGSTGSSAASGTAAAAATSGAAAGLTARSGANLVAGRRDWRDLGQVVTLQLMDATNQNLLLAFNSKEASSGAPILAS